MAIVRKHHVGNYTVVDNGFIRDVTLSLKAKGIMLILLSLPDNWVFTETWLVSQCSDGITAVRGALTELEEHKYLTRDRLRDDSGKLGDSVYNIYEDPNSQEPILENLNLENRTLLNTNNTDIDSTEIPSTNKNNMSSTDKAVVEEVVGYLNEKSGKHFKPGTRATVAPILARRKEGFTVQDFRKVIDTKVGEWKGTNMDQYLRPETLFGSKFEGYLNQSQQATNTTKKTEYRTV